jgi:hypothetical protein
MHVISVVMVGVERDVARWLLKQREKTNRHKNHNIMNHIISFEKEQLYVTSSVINLITLLILTRDIHINIRKSKVS